MTKFFPLSNSLLAEQRHGLLGLLLLELLLQRPDRPEPRNQNETNLWLWRSGFSSNFNGLSPGKCTTNVTKQFLYQWFALIVLWPQWLLKLLGITAKGHKCLVVGPPGPNYQEQWKSLYFNTYPGWKFTRIISQKYFRQVENAIGYHLGTETPNSTGGAPLGWLGQLFLYLTIMVGR